MMSCGVMWCHVMSHDACSLKTRLHGRLLLLRLGRTLCAIDLGERGEKERGGRKCGKTKNSGRKGGKGVIWGGGDRV